MTKAAKSRTASEDGVENGGDERDDVAADGVLERVQLDAADAVAEIDERSAGVGADDFVGAAEVGDAGVAGDGGNGLKLAGGRLEACVAVGRVPASAWPAASRASTRGLTGRPSAFMRATVRFDAGRIPHFKGAHLPVEAGAHGAVDGGSVVGDFADAVGGEVPERGEEGPEEGGGFVFCGVVGEQHAQALGERGGVFGHVERGRAGLAAGRYSKVVRSRTRRVVFAVGASDFLVEALAGFVAEPAALDELREDGGEVAAG